MEDLLDALLFDPDPAPDRREKLEARLDDDPELADAWAHWRRVRTHLRERLEERLSDRRLLVLYVLAEAGHTEALTDGERAALDAARDDIERALDAHPALEDVVERIREERADFEAAWAAHAEPLGAAAEGASAAQEPAGRDPERADRAARRPQSRDASARTRWTRRLALAVLVAGVAVMALLFWPGGPTTTTVTVADGSTRTVTLEDGSTVRLVGAARLSHPTSWPEDGPRRVSLREGRAFFDVPRRPDGASFVVETPTATTTVLGTQFGVRATTDTTEVVLASGSVQVGGATDEPVVLEPGQKSWVAASEAPAKPTPTDLTEALEWTGLFVFRATPLSAIADRLGRHYDAQITVAGALADEPITGTFEREQPVRQVLDALAATLGAEVQRDGDQYRLVPQP
jgi:ferric-dicitrate binding protein FerR (iron transport regulator)